MVLDDAAQQFLATTPTFLVLDVQHYWTLPQVAPDIGNPFSLRFSKTPGYTVKRYGAMQRDAMVQIAWLVTHDPKTTGVPANRAPLDTK
jgi:hypothetical protein